VITEFTIAGAGVALYRNLDKIKLRKKWKQITYSKSEFTNRLERTLKIWRIDRTPYGYDIITELPYGYTFENLNRYIDIFKEVLQFQSIQLSQVNNVVIMNCVANYKFKDYSPMQLHPNKILIADGLIKPIIVDMNKFPHMLIGGDTGTGKSRILLLILSNLIKY